MRIDIQGNRLKPAAIALIALALLLPLHRNAHAQQAANPSPPPTCTGYSGIEVGDTGCSDLQIVILIDDSASMLSNDPRNVRYDGVVELLDILAERVLIAVEDGAVRPPLFQVAAVHFGTTVGFNSGWQTINPGSEDAWPAQRELLVRELGVTKAPRNYGSTNFIHPFNAARSLFRAIPENTGCPRPVALVLTDGMPSTAQIRTSQDVADHMAQVETIAAGIYPGLDRAIYVTALSESGTDYWEITQSFWQSITRNEENFAVPRAKLETTAEQMAGRIGRIIAELTGLKNIFLDAGTTTVVPPNVERLRVTYFNPNPDTHLVIQDPDGSVFRSEPGTVRQVVHVPNPVPGPYAFERSDASSDNIGSINLILTFRNQVLKTAPPNLARVRFAFSLDPAAGPDAPPEAFLFTVSEPRTGTEFASRALEPGIQVVEIENPAAGIYSLHGAFDSGALATVYEYPAKNILLNRLLPGGEDAHLQQYTQSILQLRLTNAAHEPLVFTDPPRYLFTYTSEGGSAHEVPIEANGGEFALPILPLEAGAGELQVRVISTDRTGADCLLHESGPLALAVDPVEMVATQENAGEVCAPVGFTVENAVELTLVNTRTGGPAAISLPVRVNASAETENQLPVGLAVDEGGNAYTVRITPSGFDHIRTRITAEAFDGRDPISLLDRTFTSSGFLQNSILRFNLTGIDWGGSNLANPLYRLFYDIEGPAGEERMTGYRFFGWRLPTRIRIGEFSEVLFGYRVLGWFGPNEIEVRAAFEDVGPASAGLDRFWVVLEESPLQGSATAHLSASNAWEQTASGEYRLRLPAPGGGAFRTTTYLVRVEDRGAPGACQAILPSVAPNLLVVIPYWGTFLAGLLGVLQIPWLVRWYRNRDGEPVQEDDLTVIEGIGPAVERALNAHGIFSYAQLAITPVDKLWEIVRARGWDYMYPVFWPLQARLAALDWQTQLEAVKQILRRGRLVDLAEGRSEGIPEDALLEEWMESLVRGREDLD